MDFVQQQNRTRTKNVKPGNVNLNAKWGTGPETGTRNLLRVNVNPRET
jgi:hypothetical protein